MFCGVSVSLCDVRLSLHRFHHRLLLPCATLVVRTEVGREFGKRPLKLREDRGAVASCGEGGVVVGLVTTCAYGSGRAGVFF